MDVVLLVVGARVTAEVVVSSPSSSSSSLDAPASAVPLGSTGCVVSTKRRRVRSRRAAID